MKTNRELYIDRPRPELVWCCNIKLTAGNLFTQAVDALTGEFLMDLFWLSAGGKLCRTSGVGDKLTYKGYGHQDLQLNEIGQIRFDGEDGSVTKETV